MSWLCCALYLWESIFFKSRNTFFISKKEDDAEALCERTHFMFTKLPPFFQDFIKVDRKQCFLGFSNRSQITGAPQGEDQTRSQTLSGLVLDEAVYNERLGPTIMASIPAIGENGRITLLSSAGPSSFADIVFDRF
tara:strand:- start:2003 stop:2410 length:408 start_codon:yes stop_codon:yes gene_type:complete